jgi:outer membrane protein assembly factor BamB
MERHDAYGTKWTAANGPKDPEVLWSFNDPAGFSGGPAVAADGTLYIASAEGTVYALDPDGEVLWQVQLPAPAVGTPALDAEGRVYVADKEAGISTLTPGGELLWRYAPEGGGIATTGPVVAPDGTIYYSFGRGVRAVSADGTLLWETNSPSGYRVFPPRLNPTGELLYWQELIFDAQDGSLLDFEAVADAEDFIIGGDGGEYFRIKHTVAQWQFGELGAEVVRTIAWDSGAVGTLQTPDDGGVTVAHTIWLYYRYYNGQAAIVWLSPDGHVLGLSHTPFGETVVLAVDADDIVYACGVGASVQALGPQCVAFEPGSHDPLWHLFPEEGRGSMLSGAALVPGRLYVVYKELATGKGVVGGFLYAIGDTTP